MISHGIAQNYTDKDPNREAHVSQPIISVCFSVVPWLSF